MRLLSHNLLMCNVKTCRDKPAPLKIIVEKSEIKECDYNEEFLKRLVDKLEWNYLYQTLVSLNFTLFPQEYNDTLWQNDNFGKELHNILLQTHILEGALICENCQRKYPIVNGIPNLILNEDEI